MNKKAFLKAYQTVNKLAESENPQKQAPEPYQSNLYQSAKDEALIKEYHFAKFRKNLSQAQSHPELQSLINKEDWSEEDTQKLLAMLR
ncbi:hypothetical protein MED121_13400 [Marinomonas sp. MED121]|uniref:hypothetical protein n=1 Tax=Marinomonas sp. MED121 TaxID=314277 RepID=UPI000068FF5E|nr:hypothetical protein [Marinomonas sp. MED121]EAQ66926.1 hypothetical protein MED121_13400 [Marinomonas sp. MED121]